MRRTIALTVVTAVIGFFGVYVFVSVVRDGDDIDRPHIGPNEVSIDDVTKAPPGHKVIVRGYVFVDSNDRTLVCGGRKRGAVDDCEGRAVIATNVDTSRLDLVTGTAPSGQALRWSREAVGLEGTWTGATLAVVDIVP